MAFFKKLFFWWYEQLTNRLGRHRWFSNEDMFGNYLFFVISIIVITAILLLPLALIQIVLDLL